MCILVYRNNTGVPIFEIPPPKYSAHQIVRILLDQNIDEGRIALKRPIDAPSSSTFVVDISKLAHPDDIKKDMYGKWLHSGSHTDVFICTYNEDDSVNIEKAANDASGNNVYYLRRLHSVHPSNTEFRRVLALLFGMYFIFAAGVGGTGRGSVSSWVSFRFIKGEGQLPSRLTCIW